MMDVIILCGGRGTRLSEKTKETPKPIVEIGEFPILWHIMKIFDHYGFKRFLLALGYKGDDIKKWFLDYRLKGDFELDFNNVNLPEHIEDWKIIFKNTGLETGTAERIRQLKDDIKSDQFIMTYGDGVADIDLKKLVAYHNKQVKEHGVLATMSAVRPKSQYGLIKHDDKGLVESFEEKPELKMWINIGFIVCERKIIDYIPVDNKAAMMVGDVFPDLAKIRKLAIFKHEGVFYSMDTFKDYVDLNKLWKEDKAEWKMWKCKNEECVPENIQ